MMMMKLKQRLPAFKGLLPVWAVLAILAILASIIGTPVMIGADTPASVNFATDGLPPGTSVTVTWNGYTPETNEPFGDSTIFSIPGPGPSESILIYPESSFTFAYPSTIIADASIYNYVSADPGDSPITVAEETTVTAEYVFVTHIPVAEDDIASTSQNTPVNIDVLGNDGDADPFDVLVVTDVTACANGTVVINGDNTITYTPNTGFIGSDNFTYSISDGNGGTATATVTVNVNDENLPPEATDDTATTDEDTPVEIDVLSNDSDPNPGDRLTIGRIRQEPANGTAIINKEKTLITYIPNPDFNGIDSFTYDNCDGKGKWDIGTVTITVNPVNDAPVAVSQESYTAKNTALTINLIGSDVDGNQLSYIIKSLPVNGSLYNGTDILANSPIETTDLPYIVTEDQVTYVPDDNYLGDDSFNFDVSDGLLTSLELAAVNIHVATWDITIQQGSHGTITPIGESGIITVDHSESQTFTITPDTGYRISSVLVDGVSKGSITSYTFENISADHIITASFVRRSTGGGGGSSNPPTTPTPSPSPEPTSTPVSNPDPTPDVQTEATPAATRAPSSSPVPAQSSTPVTEEDNHEPDSSALTAAPQTPDPTTPPVPPTTPFNWWLASAVVCAAAAVIATVSYVLKKRKASI